MCRQYVDATHFLTEPCGASSICANQKRQDEQITLFDQTILVNVVGDWDMKGQICIFELDNWHVIDGIFKGLYMI